MKAVKIWCEWDMGFSNIDGRNYSVFENKEKAIKTLEKVDWAFTGDNYESWEEVEQDGLLNITEIEI